MLRTYAALNSELDSAIKESDALPVRRSKKPSIRLFDSKTLPSDQQLAAAVEINCGEWLRLKGRLPWVELHDDPDVLWIFAGDTYPANSATLARFTPASAPRRIGEILEQHLKHKTACNWVVGAASQPPDFGRYLKPHGFSCRIHCTGMACDLSALGPAASTPRGVTIELLDAPQPLEPPTTDRRKKRHEGRTLMAQMKPRTLWHFSARMDGKHIGETTLLTGLDCAGIYDVEVLEKFRRQGIGSALIDAALRHARKLGYPAAVLGATGLGSRLYQSAGFRVVGKLSFWKYGKMRQL